jgi:hypothetical protein
MNASSNRESRPKVKISERALFQRINRRLKLDGEKLCTARSESAKEELGQYYVVETGHHVRPKGAVSSGVVYVDVDLEKLAQKLGVIQLWEELEEK